MVAGPTPEWWSVIPLLRFDNKRLVEMELHPIELGKPYSRRGYSLLASGELAQRVLRHIRHLFEPFGTRLEIAGEVGGCNSHRADLTYRRAARSVNDVTYAATSRRRYLDGPFRHGLACGARRGAILAALESG